MAELSRAEAYIAGTKGREYAAVALDRADSSAEPLAWVTGGAKPCLPPEPRGGERGVWGGAPRSARSALQQCLFSKTKSASFSWHLESGCLNSIQFDIQIFKERRQHCGVETDALNRWERCLITRARYEFRGGCIRGADFWMLDAIHSQLDRGDWSSAAR